MNLLLDTATFLWLVSADSRLSNRARSEIRDPENRVWLSVVSIWEISIKQATGRLSLPGDEWSYATTARERHAIESLGLVETAIAHLTKLPNVHKDPFDRMLVCQAIEHDALLVTNDVVVREYPIKTLW